MFDRLILHNRDALFGIVAFAVALTIFVVMVWRALRMPRAQSDDLANLPFDTDTPPAKHDSDHTAS